ncbi:MAG: EAL domain-containing protein [Burkholderiaceae bacterium]
MTHELSKNSVQLNKTHRLFAPTISKKIGAIFTIIFLVAIANVVVMRTLLQNLNGVAETVNVSGKLRMMSQKIAFETTKHMLAHEIGVKEDIKNILADYETALAALGDGGNAFGYHINRISIEVLPLLDITRRDWTIYRRHVETALNVGSRAADTPFEMASITEDSARLLADAETLVSALTSESQRTQERAMMQMYGLLFLDGCVLLIVFLGTRKKIVYPLRALAQGSREFAQGNYQVKIRHRSNDEIGQLAEALTYSAKHISDLIIRIETDKKNIQEAESMFRGLAENSVVGVYITRDHGFRFVNPKMAEMFLYTQDEMIASISVFDLVPESDRHVVEENMQKRLRDDINAVHYERQAKKKDGSLFDVEVFGSKMELDGKMATIGIMLDITERKRIDRALRVLIACNQALVRATDESTLLSHICGIVQKISGYPFVWVGYVEENESKKVLPVALAEAEIGALFPIVSHVSWDEQEAGRGVTGTAIRTGKTIVAHTMQTGHNYAPWNEFLVSHGIVSAISIPLKTGQKILGALTVYSTQADTFTEDEVKIAEEMADNLAYGITALRADAARVRHAQQLEYFANHDVLTGLVNRNCLSQRLKQAISTAQRYDHLVAVLLLDLDHFKVINDSLGHAAGDELLQAVAGRLHSCVRDTDTVARLGGDEFVILMPDMVDDDAAVLVARKVLDVLSQSFAIEGHTLYISASIGVSLYPADGENEETLLKNVDMAMYRAKQNGRSNFHLYTEEINTYNRERHALENELHYALSHNELLLHYQPKVDLRTRKIVAVEALVRWNHPERGIISPSKFISIAEETGLIIPLGTWVLRTACAQNLAWQNEGMPLISIAVNLSARQFRHHDLVGLVKKVLQETAMDPQYLELELTESVLMQEAEEAVMTLSGLKELGVQLSLDDFGTGYSSLNYLRRFPLDNLKIDRLFVQGITSTNSHDVTIVKAVIALAHNLNLKVIAEGVEKEEELAFLIEQKCDEIQGFYFCKPMLAEELTSVLLSGKF